MAQAMLRRKGVRAGWLEKQSSGRAAAWEPRYFVLETTEPGAAAVMGRLRYFKSNREYCSSRHATLQAGSIDVLGAVVTPLDGHDFSVEVFVPIRKTYMLRAAAADVRDDWIASLQAVASKVQSRQHEQPPPPPRVVAVGSVLQPGGEVGAAVQIIEQSAAPARREREGVVLGVAALCETGNANSESTEREGECVVC